MYTNTCKNGKHMEKKLRWNFTGLRRGTNMLDEHDYGKNEQKCVQRKLRYAAPFFWR